MSILRAFIVFFFLTLSCGYTAESVKIYSNAENAKIGDMLNITVEASAPKGSYMTLDQEPDFDGLEVLNRKIPVSKEEGGIQKNIWQFEVMSFSLGEKEIGQAIVACRLKKSSGEKKLQSNKLKINITSVLGENDTDIKDIKENLPVKFPLIYYLIAVTAILMLFYIIMSLIKYFKNRSEKKVEIIKTPEEVAEEKLIKLQQSTLLSEGKIKQYYQELTDILREYLENRHQIQAPDMTTSELYRTLKSSNFSSDTVNSLRKLLEKSDMVKFAKFIPEENSFNTDFCEAKRIFKDIKPSVEKES